MTDMFTEKDIQQIKDLNIDMLTVEEQISRFRNGFPKMQIIKPATVGDGIFLPPESESKRLLASFKENTSGKSLVKFVPASGAASRMFKALFAFLSEGGDPGNDSPAYQFVQDIKKFAFYSDLEEVCRKNGKELDKLISSQEYREIISYVLLEEGLNYGELPKGLLKFHDYPDGGRTSVEEHLVEGAEYCRQDDGKVHLHLTVSPEHMELFKQLINQVKPKYEQLFDVIYQVDYSIQKKSTDTIAVEMDNSPFRLEDGSLLFRPAGHGALLENLSDIDADMIFIKNIDNVVPDRLKKHTFYYKKVLASIFAENQQRIFSYLDKLENGASADMLDEISKYLEEVLCTLPPADLGGKDRVSYLKTKLNRPFRVCGMVKSEGDTGGGPFWAVNKDGSVSLQIVETAQIDLDDPEQKKIFERSTHFNPNDIVCGLKNFKGEKFEISRFVDKDAGFIAKKSKDGRDLKAQELPGLWNGSMSDWNTLFVEVPFITFNPVKMVNDLLLPEHQ